LTLTGTIWAQSIHDILKIPAPGKAMSYARICLNAQFHVKKTMLTIKSASAIGKVIVGVNGCFNMLC
jgi:hypothetical protein